MREKRAGRVLADFLKEGKEKKGTSISRARQKAKKGGNPPFY